MTLSDVTRRPKGTSPYRTPTVRVTRFTSGLPKVVVVHELAILAELVTALLPDRAEVVAETASGRAGVALTELLLPDVVLVGEMLVDGVIEYYLPDLVRTGARVLLVADPADTARLLDLVAAGVTGIVDTSEPPRAVVDGILELAGGGAALPGRVTAAIAADWRRTRRTRQEGQARSDLTAREAEILGAMSDGLSTKAIAHHLGIAVKTVENHKTRVFDKLGVRTTAEAVMVALGSPRAAR